MRFIYLNDENKVVSIRHGEELVSGEIQSESGELGQVMLEDGSFIDVEQPEIIEQPTTEEEILFETKYQTLLLELMTLGGIKQ